MSPDVAGVLVLGTRRGAERSMTSRTATRTSSPSAPPATRWPRRLRAHNARNTVQHATRCRRPRLPGGPAGARQRGPRAPRSMQQHARATHQGGVGGTNQPCVAKNTLCVGSATANGGESGWSLRLEKCALNRRRRPRPPWPPSLEAGQSERTFSWSIIGAARGTDAGTHLACRPCARGMQDR